MIQRTQTLADDISAETESHVQSLTVTCGWVVGPFKIFNDIYGKQVCQLGSPVQLQILKIYATDYTSF